MIVTFDAYRQRAKEYGSAWTVFARAGTVFLEINIGRDIGRLGHRGFRDAASLRERRRTDG